MVCTKCQKAGSSTVLATPGVKRKSEMHHAATMSLSSSKPSSASSSPSTLGSNGISKSKLLSKAAKNPYAAYAATCKTCTKKTDAGRVYCNQCAYKANKCAVCGKADNSSLKKTTTAALVSGQKFSSK